MAASDKASRRISEAERARHVAADEAGAFVVMLLGALNGAEAAHQQRAEHEQQPPAESPSAPPPVHPTDAAPLEVTPADRGPHHDDQHAGAIEAPAAGLAPTVHAEAATTHAADTGPIIDPPPANETVTTHAVAPSAAVESFNAPGDHAPSATEGGNLSGSGITPASLDLGTPIHQLAATITGVIDTSLATVSHTIDNLTATVGQLTTSLTDAVSHLTNGISSTVTNLIHDTPVVGTVDTLATDVLGPTPTAPHSSDTGLHDVPLIDTAGAVPTALLHPLPLNLGFLGQPTIDGHETHDGAFSALGVHHF
jgi:hypothetical protein